MTDGHHEVIRVESAEELFEALTTATGGEIIELAAGDYGNLTLWDVQYPNIKFPETVTVRSEDPSDMASFSGMKLNGVENLTFDMIEVDFVPDENTVKREAAVQMKNVADVTFSNSVFEGGPAVNGVPYETTREEGLDSTGNVIGLPTGRAFNVYHSEGVTLENNDISLFAEGAHFVSTDGLNIIGNEIHNLRDTPLKGADLDNVLVDGNYFHNFTPWNLGGAGDHGDLIHFWTDERYQDGPSENFTVSNNYFSEGVGASLLGVYFDDDGNGLGYTNVVIENNVIQNGDSQGIRFENVDGAIIRDNTLVQSSGDKNDAPGVVLTQHSSDILIENNVHSGVYIDPDLTTDAEAASVVEINNLEVQRHDPYADGYYADIFVNAMTYDAQLEDLQALPDGPIADMGVGADATAFNMAPDALTALISPVQDLRDGDVYTFDASLTADPNGLVGAEGATYSWDFGDGETAEGLVVTHTYEAPGVYEATLTVTLPDGTTDATAATATVPDMVLLNIDFDADGPQDTSSYQSRISFAAENADSSNDEGYHLTDDNWFQARKAAVGQIYSLNEMSLSFALKPDSGDAAAGDIIRVHGDWRVMLTQDGELLFDFHNADDERFILKSNGAGLTDGEWHAVSLVYDSAEGMARFFVDGQMVGEAEMHGRTPPSGVGGFAVGNPFGSNYNGLIDDIELRGEALDAEAVVRLHEDLAGLVTGETQFAFDANYRLTFDDTTPAGDDIELRGDAAIESQDGGRVLVTDGEGDHVNLGRLEDVADSSQLSITLDFQRDEDNGSVRLLWNHTKYGVELSGGAINVVVGHEDGGVIRLKAGDVGVTNGDWHQVGVVLDETTGRVTAYLDGEVIIDEIVDGLSFSGLNRWDATLGGTAWGARSLDGQIDNVAFFDEILTGEELASFSANPAAARASEPVVEVADEESFVFNPSSGDLERIEGFDVAADTLLIDIANPDAAGDPFFNASKGGEEGLIVSYGDGAAFLVGLDENDAQNLIFDFI